MSVPGLILAFRISIVSAPNAAATGCRSFRSECSAPDLVGIQRFRAALDERVGFRFWKSRWKSAGTSTRLNLAPLSWRLVPLACSAELSAFMGMKRHNPSCTSAVCSGVIPPSGNPCYFVPAAGAEVTASNPKFNCSTFTPGSPSMPKSAESVFSLINSRTLSTGTPRAFATRAA